MYLSVSFSTKKTRVFNLNSIDGTEYLKDLGWHYVGRSSAGLKRA